MSRPYLPLSFMAVAALAFTACGGSPDSTATTATELPTVEVTATTVSARVTPQARALPGTVQASARATVSAQVTGTATAVPALGRQVETGELVLTLTAPELAAAVAQATAALDLATRNHQREAALLPRGASTAETVRNLDDQRRIAAAQLEAASARLDHTRITAPFAGTITARFIEVGDVAAPGTPLFTLEGHPLEVQVAVPESLPPATTGDLIAVELTADAVADATVKERSPAADPLTRTRLVRLALPLGTPANAGQFVRVRWPDLPTSLVIVPAAAVSPFGQMERVFVVAEGRASLRLVRIGRIQDGSAVVLAGLTPGEQVVLDPPASLRDGQPLNVIAVR